MIFRNSKEPRYDGDDARETTIKIKVGTKRYLDVYKVGDESYSSAIWRLCSDVTRWREQEKKRIEWLEKHQK